MNQYVFIILGYGLTLEMIIKLEFEHCCSNKKNFHVYSVTYVTQKIPKKKEEIFARKFIRGANVDKF